MLDMILGNWGSWLSSQAAAQNSLQLTPRSGVVSSSSLRGGALYSAGTKFLRMLRLPERILVHDPQATMGSVFTLENVVDVSIQLSGSLLVKGSSNGLLQDRALSERSIRSGISKLTPYTPYKDPQGIIYQEKLKRNRLIRSAKLYKFCDGTFTFVRRALHDIANNLRMDYLPKTRWSNLDRKRSHIMIKAIDQQLFKRRLMRNLEKFVDGREYENDFRLLERTI
ncbi:hypothetical protein Tco_0432724 [Tanacetum coccineum]